MKRIALFFIAAILATGCASTQTMTEPMPAASETSAGASMSTSLAVDMPVTLNAKADAKLSTGSGSLAQVTHADLMAAAAYATANGYPARAAVWTAIDIQLSSCEDAIAAAVPPKPTTPAGAGIFTAVEIGAEAVGNFSGVPASVKINCEPLPLITFPSFKLP